MFMIQDEDSPQRWPLSWSCHVVNLYNFHKNFQSHIHFLSRYVHHLTQDMKDLLAKAKVPIPLLSPARWSIYWIIFNVSNSNSSDTASATQMPWTARATRSAAPTGSRSDIFFPIIFLLFFFSGNLRLLPQQWAAPWTLISLWLLKKYFFIFHTKHKYTLCFL